LSLLIYIVWQDNIFAIILSQFFEEYL
jgi:hypothetical protein